jgi:hypothetical protein
VALRNCPRERLYEEILIPALTFARLELADADEQSIFRAIREIVIKLASDHQSPLHATDEGKSFVRGRILGCPAGDKADELAL